MKIRWKILILSVLFSRSAWALNISQFRPAFDNRDQFLVSRSATLPQYAWNAGLYLDFADQPLEVGTIGPLTREDSVVDNAVTMSLQAAYGITDRLSVGFVVPFEPTLSLQPLGSSTASSTSALGDIALGAKFHIWDFETREDWKMGFAVAASLTLPTGSEYKFSGDSLFTGTVKGIYDIDLNGNQASLNLGLRFREKENLLNLTVGQEFVYGVGFTRSIWEAHDVHIVTELNGSTCLNGSTGNNNISPMEWLLGVRKGFMSEKIPGRLQASLGSGLGITHGYGTPNFRVFGMLTYEGLPLMKRKKSEPEKPAVVKVEEKPIEVRSSSHIKKKPSNKPPKKHKKKS